MRPHQHAIISSGVRNLTIPLPTWALVMIEQETRLNDCVLNRYEILDTPPDGTFDRLSNRN